MSEQAGTPIAGPQRVGRRAVNERGACGGAAVAELAERSEAFMSEQATPPLAGPQRVGRRAVNERGACGGAAVAELAERSEAIR
jgi:hypothetical protein